jgi:hypothetical protein
MAQERVIVLWCDICLHDDENRVEAEDTFTYGDNELELCGGHAASHPISDLPRLASEYGHKRGTDGARRKKKPATTEAKSDGVKCPYCGLERPTVRGVNAHIGQKHKGKDLIK